jgi:hypothetical protein
MHHNKSLFINYLKNEPEVLRFKVVAFQTGVVTASEMLWSNWVNTETEQKNEW